MADEQRTRGLPDWLDGRTLAVVGAVVAMGGLVMTSSNARLDGLGSRFDDMHGRFDDMHGRFDDIHKRIDGVNASIVRLDGRLRAVETDVAEIRGRLGLPGARRATDGEAVSAATPDAAKGAGRGSEP